MSSTALCLKSLANFGALSTPAGRLAIAVLLFQDLAAVVLFVIHDAALAASVIDGVFRFLIGAVGLTFDHLLQSSEDARQSAPPRAVVRFLLSQRAL